MTTDDPSDLEARLRRLEAVVFSDATASASPPEGPPDQRSNAGDDTFWALRGLEERTTSLEHGAVLFTGSVTVAAGPVQWQYARPADDLLALGQAVAADDPAAESPDKLSATAARLAAIGSPVRLRLLLAVANGTTTLVELGELDGIGTTGQVYHHVRVLTSAGWLQSAGRGRVAIPPARIVPLLAAVAAME